MESQFWDVLAAHPFFVFVVVVGGVFAASALLGAFHKLHDYLGFKTKAELEREEYLRKEKERDEQIKTLLAERERQMREIWDEIKEMRRENNEQYQKLERQLENSLESNIMIMGDRISQKCKYYLRIGYIPAEEMPEFRAIYDTYKKNGGNHGVDDLFEKTVASLPLQVGEG